jgi:prevent-host-death family protein
MSDHSSLARFSTVDLVRSTDDVKRAALREPVGITEHSKTKFVLMTVEDYNRLRGAGNPHRHFHAEETPDFIVDLFGDELGLTDATADR